jgi:hypothetical protein
MFTRACIRVHTYIHRFFSAWSRSQACTHLQRRRGHAYAKYTLWVWGRARHRASLLAWRRRARVLRKFRLKQALLHNIGISYSDLPVFLVFFRAQDVTHARESVAVCEQLKVAFEGPPYAHTYTYMHTQGAKVLTHAHMLDHGRGCRCPRPPAPMAHVRLNLPGSAHAQLACSDAGVAPACVFGANLPGEEQRV